MVWRDDDTSSIGMDKPEPCALRREVTVTSFICVASVIFTTKRVLFIGIVTVLYPTKDTRRRFLGLFSLNEKLPLMSVTVEATIRFAASTSTTFAIITGPKASVTVPLTMSPAFCAMAP